MRKFVVPLVALASAAAVLTFGAAPLRANELLPVDKPVEEVVDFYVDAKLQEEAITPAPAAEDANFIRRVTLDLAGRIPTIAEVQAYLQSEDADKKPQLVDRLLGSPDFAFHQRNEVDVLLMAGYRANSEWREWLHKAFVENRPWPQIFRELMLGRDGEPAEKPALTFLKSRAANIDDLTNDTSRIFFGVSISCAKCHDHPLVSDWTQDHYFGMASFFNRTYLTKKNFLAERDDGVLKFRTTAGQEKRASLMFLTGAVISEPAPPERTEAERKEIERTRRGDMNKESPPDPPTYSRRAQLVEVALKPDPEGFFPRAFVNRTWAQLLGEGLVTPLDQMHTENKPSHPQLLSWLARDLEAHSYDQKRLIRGLVLSRAYGRSSRCESPGARPSERLFAVAAVRPLTPMQFSMSLSLATSNPLELSDKASRPEEWATRRRELEEKANGFAQQLEIPGERFQVGVAEALLFSNSPQIDQDYLRDSPDRLLGVLQGISDREQLINTGFLALFSRPAQPEEVAAVSAYLAVREDRSAAALRQALWSLVASGEFRFNY